MIDDLVRAFRRPEQKAASGIGMSWFSTEPYIGTLGRNPMKQAQQVAVSNRWIRAAERVISHSFGTVPWHLETPEGDHVTDESPEVYKAIKRLLEMPYSPRPGDPINATPKTRSGLWGLTSRHKGVCGSAFWFLDQADALAGLPLQLLYINPARMTPAGEDNRLVGWVLDKDARGGGTPLRADQVLHFTLEEPDDGFLPPGLVETAMNSVSITKYADRHAAGTLASGGKMPGIVSPRGDAIIPPDVFKQMELELRAAAESPDHARRSMILRGPVDFTPTAATPQQLDLVAVQSMSRDDILGLWGVPLSQLGIATPAGLNSGSTKSYDEAALWQKAVHPRLIRFWEVVQFQLLDRFGALGYPVELVIEEPTFDDDAPKWSIAQQAQNMPMRNSERRALVGLDPFGVPELDDAIVLPMNIVEYGTSVSSRPADDLPLEGTLAPEVKAKNLLPRLERDLAAFLREQQKAIASRIRANAAHLAKKPNDTSVWWNGADWDKRLTKVLQPYAATLADQAAKQVGAKVAGKAGFTDLVGNGVLQRLLSRLGTRIKGINETTREKVSAAIREGIEAGDGAAQLGDRIEAAAAFDEYRAELIARTESARVLNEAALESYREFGVTKVRAIDGDEDPECAARDGQEYDLDDALDISDHPNGTLDWAPVVGAA